jgi:hypothetical protein
MTHLYSEPFARGTELRLPPRRPTLSTLITSSANADFHSANRPPQPEARRTGSEDPVTPPGHDDRHSSRPPSTITAMPLLSYFTMKYVDMSHFVAPTDALGQRGVNLQPGSLFSSVTESSAL